jgi:hypothetical protein
LSPKMIEALHSPSECGITLNSTTNWKSAKHVNNATINLNARKVVGEQLDNIFEQ